MSELAGARRMNGGPRRGSLRRRRWRACATYIRGPRWYLYQWLFRNQLGGPATEVHGIVVHHADVEGERLDNALRNLGRALALIEQRDPRRWNRLRRDGTTILLGTLLGKHNYNRISNVMTLDMRDILETPVELLAVTIVHEATHARIARATKRPKPLDLAREERRCMEESIAFVRRYSRPDDPNLEAWIAYERAQLSAPRSTRRERRLQMVQALEENGGAAWLVRLGRRLS